MRSPGQPAGGLTSDMAERFGLIAGTPVSTASLTPMRPCRASERRVRATLVMVLGTSSCHMLNATKLVDIPGVAGVVEGGILPGLFGYETGQAAVGDAFAWLLRLLNLDDFGESVPCGNEVAARCRRRVLHRLDEWLPNATDGWWGSRCIRRLGARARTGSFVPVADGSIRVWLRWIVELLSDGGVPIDRLIATGGLPHHNRAFVEVYADVLGNADRDPSFDAGSRRRCCGAGNDRRG